MIAICAVLDKEYASLATRFLAGSGYDVLTANSRNRILSILEDEDVSLVLCDIKIGKDVLTDLPYKYPKPAWIARMVNLRGLAAASAACMEYQFDDYLPEVPCASNLYVAIWRIQHAESKEPLGNSNGLYAYFQSLAVENPVSRDGEACLEGIYAQSFRNVTQGTFAHSHFSSIFFRILKNQLTGRLHLWRPGLHWVVLFKDGIPFDVELGKSGALLDVVSTDPEQYDDELSTRHERILSLKDPAGTLRGWLAGAILEIFAWPQADFMWMEDSVGPRQDYHPQYTPKECLCLLEVGVTSWMNSAFILEVTRPCMPYFLKIRDPKSPITESFSIPGIRAVVEKLKIGDTLTEMLTDTECGVHVHSTVYLLAMMGQLDLIS